MKHIILILDSLLVLFSGFRILGGSGNYLDYIYLFFAVCVAYAELHRRKETRD